MAPLEIVCPFPAIDFRKLTISLVILRHVLVVDLIFILVPLVVVATGCVVVPLGVAV